MLHHVPHVHMLMSPLQGQASAKVQSETGTRKKRDSKAGRAACTASLALTMLLMLKRFLKATYNMSEERIAAFSPDRPEKRKQVSLHWLMSCKPVPCLSWPWALGRCTEADHPLCACLYTHSWNIARHMPVFACLPLVGCVLYCDTSP